MSLRERQQQVDTWISQFEEGYWDPLANLARLTEEVGELAREINHGFGPKAKKAAEPEGSVAEELGDVLFVIMAIANSLEIDLDEAFEEVLRKYRDRDANRWEKLKS